MHTGAHKLNNALGQVVLAQRLGKTRIIAETGAGQHGVATATVCARFGLECVVYMGSEDMRRQHPNVERMGLLGAEVRPVEFGTKTLKEATSEAIRDWITNVETTHYLIGSCVGPEPYPEIVRELQAVIGRESREQILEAEGRLPDAAIACVGGGSNAIGMFAGFLDDADVRLYGVEAAGAASLGTGRPGVLHGARSSLLADEDGQITDAHSISAGLDYPGVGPEHAYLRDTGRVEYLAATDDEALEAFRRLAETEGIIPALEPSHALARAPELDGERDRRLPLRPRRQGPRRGARPPQARDHRFEPTTSTRRSAPHEPVARRRATATRSRPGASTPAAARPRFEPVQPGGNPQTGPFYVEGASRGDTLAVPFDRPCGRTGEVGFSQRARRPPQHPRPARSPPSSPSSRASTTSGRSTSSAAPRRLEEPPAGLELARQLADRADARLLRRRAGARPGDLVPRPRPSTAGTWTTAASAQGVTVYFPVVRSRRAPPRRRRPRAPGRRRDRRHRDRDLVRRRVHRRVVSGARRSAGRAPTTTRPDRRRQRAPARPGGPARDDRAAALLEEDYGLDYRAGSALLGQCIRYDVGNVFDPAYTVVAKLAPEVISR